MMAIASIVEGDGEVVALPLLLRRMAAELDPGTLVNPLQPIRVRRDKFINKEEEFRRQLLLAAAKCGDGGWILIVLDADDDCPATLGAQLLQRAQAHVPHRRISVVLANREFEAWFIAAAQSLHEVRGFAFDPNEQVDAEVPRDAKGWMKARMQRRAYSPLLDQPAFTASMDLQQAKENSRSFTKLIKEWRTNIQVSPAGVAE